VPRNTPRKETARVRLDTPKEQRRQLVRRPTYDPDAFGSFAERFARFMGTAKFLLYMTLFVAIWLGWNWAVPADMQWDAYPFIFLTLMLSLQASYAAPLILLAQNRGRTRPGVTAGPQANTGPRRHGVLAREMASCGWRSARWPRDYARSELGR
jgi:uncharacterized membrane protein